MARHLRVEFRGAIYHVTCRMLGDAQSRLFRYLIKYAGMSQRKVAVFLGAGSGTAINKHLLRYSEAFKKDRRLRRLLKNIEQRLEEERCNQRTGNRIR